MRALFLALAALSLAGCLRSPTRSLPAPQYTFDVYTTKEGVTVIVDGLTGDSVGYTFHVDSIYTIPKHQTEENHELDTGKLD